MGFVAGVIGQQFHRHRALPASVFLGATALQRRFMGLYVLLSCGNSRRRGQPSPARRGERSRRMIAFTIIESLPGSWNSDGLVEVRH